MDEWIRGEKGVKSGEEGGSGRVGCPTVTRLKTTTHAATSYRLRISRTHLSLPRVRIVSGNHRGRCLRVAGALGARGNYDLPRRSAGGILSL